MGRKLPQNHLVKSSAANNVGIYLRIDRSVLEWFRQSGNGYQTRIKKVLTDHIQQQNNLEQRRIQQAQDLFNQYHAACFWHLDPNTEITQNNIGMVVEGLKKYGGHQGWAIAEKLEHASD